MQAEEVEFLMSELAKVTGGERALIEECGGLLSKTHAYQVWFQTSLSPVKFLLEKHTRITFPLCKSYLRSELHIFLAGRRVQLKGGVHAAA